MKTFKINKKKYFFDPEKLCLYSGTEDEISDDSDTEIKLKNNKRTLTKAVFNVANCCNLRCVYCYGSGGNYGRESQIMTKETADKIISEIKTNYDKIYDAFFFGGEPLANFEILKYITEQVKSFTTQFRIVTNATLLNEEIIDYFKKNNFKIYISCDGPEYINDHLRGKGSFKLIDKWLKYFVEQGMKDQVEISCTYTKYHYDNIKMQELLDFFESYDLKYMLHTVSTTDKTLLFVPREGLINYEKKFIDRSIDRLYNKSNNCCISTFVKNVIEGLTLSKKQTCFCRELDKNLSIVYDFNGDKYPCVRLLGSFKSDNKQLCLANKKTSNKCRKCWARNICSFCTADVLLKNRDFPYKKLFCSNKILYNYTIKKIIDLIESDPEKLKVILKNYLSDYIY